MVNELIFVVDDDAPLRGLMRALLEDKGYAVQDFESGDALLEALDDNPSLILLDAWAERSGNLETSQGLTLRPARHYVDQR